MRFGLTAKMMAEAMLPYPTMAEAVRWDAAHFQDLHRTSYNKSRTGCPLGSPFAMQTLSLALTTGWRLSAMLRMEGIGSFRFQMS
jgi:hypothetical protein